MTEKTEKPRWQVEIYDASDCVDPVAKYELSSKDAAIDRAMESIRLLERYGNEKVVDGVTVLVVRYGQGGHGDPVVVIGWEYTGKNFRAFTKSQIADANCDLMTQW